LGDALREATGDYAGAKQMFDKLAIMRPNAAATTGGKGVKTKSIFNPAPDSPGALR
jgi:hypothetical protein